MENGWAQFGRLLLMAVFLCASACCSGTETAFFSLTRREILQCRRSGSRVRHLVADLSDAPSDLLGALLLGNLIVNILFFAASSVLMMSMKQQGGVTLAALVGLATFVALVLVGEVLPKSLAYAHPERFSEIMALPTALLVRGLTPAVRFFRGLFAEPCLRLLLGPRREARNVTGEEFKALIEVSRQQGVLTISQGRLFAEVVDFHLLRVRHVMRPRVDLVACALETSRAEALALVRTHQVTMLFIHEGSLDNIVGQVEVRDLLLSEQDSLQDLLRPILFVPEQKTVESLLQFFRKMRVDTAVVVDEYGGVAGAVQVEDVAETLFGPMENNETDPVQQMGPFQYRLFGGLAIHEWCESLGIELEKADVATVGGWVASLMRRIPRRGDKVTWKHLHFEVEAVERHRIKTVVLTIGSQNEHVN